MKKILKENEYVVVAVNVASGTYRVDILDLDEAWSNENPTGFRYSALYPFCNVYEFNTMEEATTFCNELDEIFN